MPRKQFQDLPYDPIGADLAREVAAAGRGASPAAPVAPPVATRVPNDRVNHLQITSSTRRLATASMDGGGRITKRFILSRKEDDDLNAFLLRLQTRGEAKVTLSVIVRAALSVLMQAEEQILQEVGDRFPQEYPSTHDSLALGEFEERWTLILLKALRRLPRTNLI